MDPQWFTGANKQQTSDHLVRLATNNSRKAESLPTIFASTTSTNIFCPFLFSALHSTTTFASPTYWAAISGKQFTMVYSSLISETSRLMTLNHRLSLLLIPSGRLSKFLFTSLHPVCLHSELKSYLRRYILFHVPSTLPIFPNCSRISDKQVV